MTAFSPPARPAHVVVDREPGGRPVAPAARRTAARVGRPPDRGAALPVGASPDRRAAARVGAPPGRGAALPVAPPAPANVGTVLERAAALIERQGWCRGQFRDEHGRVCLDFALLAAGRERNEEARRYVEEELARRGAPAGGVVVWNDHHARDQREVLDVVRRAARRASGRGGRGSRSASAAGAGR